MRDTIPTQRSTMSDTRSVDRLIVFLANRFVVAIVGAVVGSQIELARARQGHVKAIKSFLGRSLDVPEPPRASRTDLENVSGASWERLGESSVRPKSAKGVHKGAQERQRERPGASESTPKRPKSIPRHVRKRKHRVFPVQHDREAFSIRMFDDFRRLWAFSERWRTL